MSNLDLTISDIFYGDTAVLKIMKGDEQKWPYLLMYNVTISLTNTTSDAPARVEAGTSLTINLTAETGYAIASCSVMMGDVDITSTAYNNGVIYISEVTGDVSVVAVSDLPYIVFEDTNVKTICVNNWGGGVVAGEITPAEAALVTTLGGKFQSNTSITKFNELRYFTGLTTLDYNNSANGQFYNCTKLTEVTLPEANVSNLLALFRNTKVKVVDLTPLKGSGINLRNICRSNTGMTKLILKGTTYGTNWYYSFDTCTNLTTINVDGTADLNSVANFDHSFNNCTKLSTITGTITNIAQSIDFHSCPLTLDSILVILNGLKSGVTGKTLTLKNTASGYTNPIKGNAQYESIATDKGWTIAYS